MLISAYLQPAVVQVYNKYKGGVDVTDQVTKKFSCQRATRRWTKALFENFVDIAIHNSYIMFKWANPKVVITKREYMEWLAKEMAITHVQARRKNIVGLHTGVVHLMDNFLLNYNQKYGPTTSPTAACIECGLRKNLLICARCKSATFCENHFREKKFYRCMDCKDVADGEVFIKSGAQRCLICARHLERKTPVYCHNCGRNICAKHKKTDVQLKLCRDCFAMTAPQSTKEKCE